MVNKMQTARGLALSILGEIFQDGAFSNIALKKGLGKANLSEVDKSLVTEIVYGTVSRKLTLEWYLSHFVADRDQVDPWIYHLLLMSLYQFVYLEKIPPHAVVHEAVELAKQRKKGSENMSMLSYGKYYEKGFHPLTGLNESTNDFRSVIPFRFGW